MAFNEQEFRRIVGSFATGVTIVATTDGEGKPRGFTANAFASLSLDPPLVLVCVDKTNETHGLMTRGEGAFFSVNILADHQENLSEKFARKGGSEKFENTEFCEGETGAPVFVGVLAFMECKAVGRFDGGDHAIVVGEVKNLGANGRAEPLLFYRGGYGTLHPRTVATVGG